MSEEKRFETTTVYCIQCDDVMAFVYNEDAEEKGTDFYGSICDKPECKQAAKLIETEKKDDLHVTFSDKQECQDLATKLTDDAEPIEQSNITAKSTAEKTVFEGATPYCLYCDLVIPFYIKNADEKVIDIHGSICDTPGCPNYAKLIAEPKGNDFHGKASDKPESQTAAKVMAKELWIDFNGVVCDRPGGKSTYQNAPEVVEDFEAMEQSQTARLIAEEKWIDLLGIACDKPSECQNVPEVIADCEPMEVSPPAAKLVEEKTVFETTTVYCLQCDDVIAFVYNEDFDEKGTDFYGSVCDKAECKKAAKLAEEQKKTDLHVTVSDTPESEAMEH